jgi:hypothetical protein
MTRAARWVALDSDDTTANLAVDYLGLPAILAACGDPLAALDMIFGALYCERSIDDRLN